MTTNALVVVTMHWTHDNLSTHIPRGKFSHHLPNGRPPWNSLVGGLPRRYPSKGPLFNPHVKSFGWLASHSHMFMPPLYPPIVHDLYKSKWINYPIKSCNTQFMFKTLTLMLTLKYSRRPIKLMVKLWNLTLSTYLVSFSKTISLNGDENFVQVHPRFLANSFKPWKMTRKSICNYKTFNSKLLNVWSFIMNTYSS